MNILHYSRMVTSGEFSYHDFGSKKANMKHYGQASPPLYNTTHIAETFTKFPSFLLAGENDALVSKHDLEKLRKIIEPSGTRIETIPTFAHLDYVWGKEAKEKIYNPTLQFIIEHTTPPE